MGNREKAFHEGGGVVSGGLDLGCAAAAVNLPRGVGRPIGDRVAWEKAAAERSFARVIPEAEWKSIFQEAAFRRESASIRARPVTDAVMTIRIRPARQEEKNGRTLQFVGGNRPQSRRLEEAPESAPSTTTEADKARATKKNSWSLGETSFV